MLCIECRWYDNLEKKNELNAKYNDNDFIHPKVQILHILVFIITPKNFTRNDPPHFITTIICYTYSSWIYESRSSQSIYQL